MRIWNIKKGIGEVVAYVQVLETCTIFDTAYAALQLVRSKYPNENINCHQLLDVARGETMQENIPVYQLA